MTEESYIVAFRAGSSGRFLANILYSILRPEGENSYLAISKFNSAHESNDFRQTFRFIEEHKMRPASRPDVYTNFFFIEYPGVIVLHTPPNFSTISKNFPKTKLIIISFTDNELDEILGNSLVKNGIENVDKKINIKDDIEVSLLVTSYFRFFREPFNIEKIDTDKLKTVFNHNRQIIIKKDSFIDFYKNPIIPDDFINKTLILSYYDLVNDPTLILNKLLEFTNRKIVPNNALDYYNNYLDGRKIILGKYLPWIKI